MKCEEVSKGLIAYVDGRANPAERSVVEAHLAVCAACEEELWSSALMLPAFAPLESAAIGNVGLDDEEDAADESDDAELVF